MTKHPGPHDVFLGTRYFGALDGLKKLTSLTINLEWNFRLTNKSLQVLCSKLRGLTQLKQLRVYMSK